MFYFYEHRNKIHWLGLKAVLPTLWGLSHQQWGIVGCVAGPTLILQLLHYLQRAQREGGGGFVRMFQTGAHTTVQTVVAIQSLLKDSQIEHTWFMALFSQVSTATPTCRRRSNRASAFNFIVFGERVLRILKTSHNISAISSSFVIVGGMMTLTDLRLTV